MIQCPLCESYEFASCELLFQKLIYVSTKKISCPICSETLNGLDKFTIHLGSHVLNDEITLRNLNRDFQSISLEMKSLAETNTRDITNTTVFDASKLPTQSDYENFFDHSAIELTEKLLAGNNGTSCNEYSKEPGKKDNTNVKSQLKTLGTKQWDCAVCEKSFTTKYFLKKHQRLHTGEMPYKCEECGKCFTFQQSYRKHILYHSDDKPHKCGECGKTFKEISTLQNHQRIHTGEKPFSCSVCYKKFRQRVSRLVHERIHSGIKPYQCTVCLQEFRYKISERAHKCTSDPPGVIIKLHNPLLQKLKFDNSNLQTSSCQTLKKDPFQHKIGSHENIISLQQGEEHVREIDNNMALHYNEQHSLSNILPVEIPNFYEGNLDLYSLAQNLTKEG